MGKNILHLIYCIPKLHFHHAATYEGWTSVSATVATVSWSWVWQILSPQAGSWWWLGLSPTFWIHWRSIAALEALSMLDDITFGWWWTGTNSQSSTSKALTWIQCKLGKQYLVKKFTLPWESNPGPTPIRGDTAPLIASVGFKKNNIPALPCTLPVIEFLWTARPSPSCFVHLCPQCSTFSYV